MSREQDGETHNAYEAKSIVRVYSGSATVRVPAAEVHMAVLRSYCANTTTEKEEVEEAVAGQDRWAGKQR